MNYLFKNTFINFLVVIVKSETTTVFRILTYLFVKPVIFSNVGFKNNCYVTSISS